MRPAAAPRPARAPRRQRGAALLLAMVILTLVATLAAAMVWQQARGIAVESAERSRAQAAWILAGALEFGRVILRLDARTPGVDHLGEPWAMQLQESSLAGLLAVDRANTAAGGPEAYLLGRIGDAQSRYNLRNLVDNERRLLPAEVAALARLCDTAGVPREAAQTIAQGLQAAWAAQAGKGSEGSGLQDAPLAPRSVAQLVWLGIDPAAAAALQPYVDLLPEATPLNLNTASAEVLAGVFAGLDAGSAQRLVEARQAKPFRSIDEARAYIQDASQLDPRRAAVGSRYFELTGRLRIENRQIEERVLVVRQGREVGPLWRERRSIATDAR